MNSKPRTKIFTLPQAFNTAFMDGDYSGLEQFEIDLVNTFLKNNNLGACIGISETPIFQWKHDFPKIGGATCVKYTFLEK